MAENIQDFGILGLRIREDPPHFRNRYMTKKMEDTTDGRYDRSEKKVRRVNNTRLFVLLLHAALSRSLTRSPQPAAQAPVRFNNERDSSWAAPSTRCYVICASSLSIFECSDHFVVTEIPGIIWSV